MTATQALGYLALFVAGLFAGTLNVLAGGGSFLTIPLLIFLGLPPTVANATNRIGVLLQNVGAVWHFHRHRVLDWRFALAATVPATVGAVAGTIGALLVSDKAFTRILAFLMIALTLYTLWDARRRRPAADAPPPRPRPFLLAAGFFVVGLYGGFVQAGVGFLILAATTLAGLDLVRGNAVKVLAVLGFTVVSLGIFAWSGKVEWLPGLILGAGTLLGGLLGARLTLLKGNSFVRWVVTVAVLVFAVKLLLT
jgi:uncharacterized membrane protein YfcA